jgi:hypothetical protein
VGSKVITVKAQTDAQAGLLPYKPDFIFNKRMIKNDVSDASYV